MAAPDFVVVGHVTLDRIGDTIQPGGAAFYAAVAAHRLGLSVGILTSHGDDFPLELIPPQIEVVSVPAEATTTFVYEPGAVPRTMTVSSVASALGPADVPEDWVDASLVLLAPVAGEIDPLLATAFTGPTLAAAAQGWLRAIEPAGAVTPAEWTPPEFLLGRLQAIFLSTEDVAGQEEAAIALFERVPIGVLTAGRLGALLFVNGERYEIAPRPTQEVDATGAGDVFAAHFLIHYQHGGDAWDAAAAASCAGSLSVEAAGIAAVPDRARLDAALREHLRDS
ncbi:MAG TPA: PfkB family carbohydrate kinase [Candidatus Acidoferrum sp.]|nr:PfkB family carbohydrate kinase [Candidatus Acidoferrum sp.]